jgi:hypothetical protein
MLTFPAPIFSEFRLDMDTFCGFGRVLSFAHAVGSKYGYQGFFGG